MKHSRLIIASALAALLGIVAVGWLASELVRGGARSAMFEIGGPFVLAAARGGTLDSRSLAGKPYAVFFGFTHCPEVCPTTLYEMSSNLVALGDAARDVRVFFITVDPARDTVAAMKDYVANFDPRIEALVPTEDQLRQLASDFRIYFAKVPTSDGGYTMDHTATIFLFDRTGSFAGTIGYGEAAEMREAKLNRLIGP